MARTNLPAQTITPAGAALTYTAADNVNGMNMPGNNGYIVFHVKNTAGSPQNAIVRANGLMVGGQTLADDSVSVPATTGDRVMGPYDPVVYNQADGSLNVDFSGASMTIAVIKVR